jgi:hypothetical protein
MFGKLGDFISGKGSETPEQHIARLTRLAQEEEQRTKDLQTKLEEQKLISNLQKKVLDERAAQQKAYGQMGVDSPQVQKSKRVRRYIFGGVALFIIFILLKACIK